MDNKKYSILIWSLIALGIIGIVLGMIAVVSYKSGGPQGNSGNLTEPVNSSDWIRGSKDAKVVLVEYSDFQCPACDYFYSQVKQLEKDFDGKIAVVYRYFPLEQVHKNARLSARAAEAAGRQGKFWEMHDLLFENQNAWAESSNAIQAFDSYAQSLGLDMNKFNRDINSSDIDVKINNDYQSGVNSGVQGTPTFFINGKQIENPQSYDAFKSIIEAELNK